MARTNGAGAGKKPRRKPDRAATERALMKSALELLERDGVLAGLNMQEVADRADLNRGLIHHYFGTRHALLRAAIERGLEDFAPEAERRRRMSPRERGVQQFRDFVENSRYVKLIALLALDDEPFEPIAFLEQRLEDIEREREAGAFPGDADLAAFLIAWDAMLLGYSLIRKSAAGQLDVAPRDLDRRILATMQRLRPAHDNP